VQKDKETNEAIKDLRALFPKVPVAFPDGAGDEESTYLHLLVNYLEYRADREILGELRTSVRELGQGGKRYLERSESVSQFSDSGENDLQR
jgi:hypothetical protein